MPLIDESFVAQKAFEYAQLCELSKANWVWNESSQEWLLGDSEYSDIWRSLRAEYKVLNFWDDTQRTGYVGVLFYNSETRRTILANRGTDGPTTDDSTALSNIASRCVPSEQFRSMVDCITYGEQRGSGLELSVLV